MIKYNLICAQDHEFEGWFRDGATYDTQSQAGEVTCPVCGIASVRKAPMAPSVVSSRRAEANAASASQSDASSSGAGAVASDAPPDMSDLRDALLKLRRQIEQNATDVGERFADEARRMHYGETEEKPIYGKTSAEERDSLRDEGIDVMPIPWIRMDS